MRKLFLTQKIIIAFVTLITSVCLLQTIHAKTNNNILQETQLTLNSNSFNAHKKSSFKVLQQSEQVERGLTILHLNTDYKFEFKNFDTYSSEEALSEMITILESLLKTVQLLLYLHMILPPKIA